jgi:hypothetical protein
MKSTGIFAAASAASKALRRAIYQRRQDRHVYRDDGEPEVIENIEEGAIFL